MRFSILGRRSYTEGGGFSIWYVKEAVVEIMRGGRGGGADVLVRDKYTCSH